MSSPTCPVTTTRMVARLVVRRPQINHSRWTTGLFERTLEPMSERSSKSKRQSDPAGESDERLLDDLAAGHVGQLSRNCSGRGGQPPRPETTDEEPKDSTAPVAADSPAETTEQQPPEPAGEPAAENGSADEAQREENDRGGGAVEELLSAVERIAGRRPSQPRRKDPLLGAVRTRPRLRLKLPAGAGSVLAQAAAVSAGAAGTALLAWVMFG
ncbi:MAG: hypothetical protein ACP5HU_06085 [Phycisphaerae bacterium]